MLFISMTPFTKLKSRFSCEMTMLKDFKVDLSRGSLRRGVKNIRDVPIGVLNS